ncbi:MAG: PAS domain S-box protein [Flavobacteriaceae bacterium]|nr:PAS domain S-box protein [Flavobacteriaceae bacterium]
MKVKNKNTLVFCESDCLSGISDKMFLALESNFNVLRVNTIQEYTTSLKEEAIDCVLIFSSLTDNKVVQNITRNFLSFPHIIVTEEANESKAQKLFNKGLKDYVITENLSRLLPVINREINAFEDRKKVNSALSRLERAKETLNSHFENAPLATISWDLDFKVIKWNKSAVEMFGYTASEAIGKNCLELIVPKGLENTAQTIIKDLVNQKGITDNINETLCKNNKIKVCHWHNTILKDKEGKTTGIISSIEDITKKRKIHNEVLRSKHLLQQSQKLSEVYFIDLSFEEQRIILDKEFVKLSNLTPKEYYKPQELLKELIYPIDRIKLLRAYNKAFKSNNKLSVDIRVVYADGTVHWVNILANKLSDETLEKKSFVGTFIDITDRKNELLKLKADEKRLKLSINIAQIGFLDWDFKNDIIKVSGKTKQIFNLNKNKKVFKFADFLSKIHPNDVDKAKKALHLTKTENRPYHLNYRLLRDTGGITWVNILGEIDFNGHDKDPKMIAIVRDITKQVTRERRLLQHSLILNQLNSLILVMDKNSDFIFASSSVFKLTGYNIEEVLGRGWWDVSYVSEEEKLKSKNYFISILDNTKVINNLRHERKVLCKDGSVKWFNWQFSRGAEGTIIGLAHDSTKEKEKEYLVSKLFKAIENSPTIVVITDINGKIEYVNPKYEEVTGYTAKETIGRNPRVLKSGETPPKEYRNLWQTISKGKTWRGEFKNIKKDGTAFWEKAIITPVKNSEGVITNYIALKEDITEAKQQEKKFLYALFEAQEKEKLKFGEELHDSLSQILSAMSFYLEAVLNPKNNKDHLKVEYLEKVRQLSEDALRESRHISHGLMSKQLLKGGLVAAINEICENYNVSRNIKFIFNHKNYNGAILDAQTKQNIYRITQEITTNIVRHAVASEAHVKISIEDDKWFLLEIKDNGIGIDPKAVKEKSKSFGLTNIQQRVSLLSGHVKRTSKMNKGTKYNIKIPIDLEIIETESD